MESASEISNDSMRSTASAQSEESLAANEMVFETRFRPHEDEPLADPAEVAEEPRQAGEEERDEDGLTLRTIEARYERERPVDSWCSCGKCSDDQLVGAREFRCCWEVNKALGKLQFDGSIERISCTTDHEDFRAMTNTAVLLQVGPILKTKGGKHYRKRPGVSQNEYLRAVAYRWVARYLFGYMGWDHTRPMPACIYDYIRRKYPTGRSTGYAAPEERD